MNLPGSSLPAPWSGPFNRKDTFDMVGLPLGAPLKNAFREKRWCYTGIVSPDLFFGAAVVHLGYAASAFCFGFDRQTGKMTEFDTVMPPVGRVRYDRNPDSGVCRFKAPGKTIEISGRADGHRNLRVDLGSGNKALAARIDFSAPGFLPMHFPMDMGRGKAAFTTKAAGLPADGEVRIGDKVFSLAREETFALFDWTHGAYHRQTFWNWACGAGHAREETNQTTGLGFNFSRGVYENGRLENTLWIDGKPEPVAPMDYRYDPQNPTAPWDIVSRDKKIRLTFFPEGMRQADDNFILLASRFIQPCGRFEGQVTTASGRVLTLDRVSGVVEEHYAKW